MWMLTTRRRIGVAMTCLMASFAFANDDPLSLAEAQRLATSQSEKLQAGDFAQSAAEELTHVAGRLPDPVLRLGLDNVPVSGIDRFNLNNDFMTMSRVGVMQEFTRRRKRELRTERAEESVAVAHAERETTLATVRRETALAWFGAYYAQRRHDLVAEQLDVARTAAAAADSAFAQGRDSSVDVLIVRAAVAQIEDQLTDAAYRERAARIDLARWIGAHAERPLTTRPPIDTLPLHAHRDDAALEAQLREHPDIQAADRRYRLAQTEAELARADRKSDWSVELSYGRRGPEFPDMLSLGVSIPLQVQRGNRQDRELAARIATASAAKAERDDMYRAHVAEVRTMLDGWSTARERHERYEKELLPLARDRIRAAEAGYRGGKIKLEDMVAAHRNLIDVSLQTLQLDAELARLWAELSFLGAGAQDSGARP